MSDLVERLRERASAATDNVGALGEKFDADWSAEDRAEAVANIALDREAAARISELEAECAHLAANNAKLTNSAGDYVKVIVGLEAELAEARSHGPGHKPDDPIAKRESEGETEAE